MINIGRVIHAIRNKNDMTQEEFATVLGTSRQTVYYWEKNRLAPSPKYLKDIAETFNVSVDTLLDIKIYKTKDPGKYIKW